MNTFGIIRITAGEERGGKRVSHYLVFNILKCNCRSVDCFRLGWPMRADADFFCLPPEQFGQDRSGVKKKDFFHPFFISDGSGGFSVLFMLIDVLHLKYLSRSSPRVLLC